MVNLSLITKIEEFDEFFRIYLVSGDVEEIEHDSFMSALNASETGYFKYKVDEVAEPKTAIRGVSDSDIEDMTTLSDGTLVNDWDLAEPTTNTIVEGSEASEELKTALSSLSRDELIEVLSKLQQK